jgi:hypothetical protein
MALLHVVSSAGTLPSMLNPLSMPSYYLLQLIHQEGNKEEIKLMSTGDA